MNISLSGKVAMVTGASRGLGRAISLALGKAGANVVVTDLLVEDEGLDHNKLKDYGAVTEHFAKTDHIRTKSTAAEIKEMGSQSLGLKMDVTQTEEIDRVVHEVEKTMGHIDILVNNAGLVGNFALFGKQRTARWELDLKVNLSGAFNCTKAVWSGMIEKKWGRIINISSIMAKLGTFAQPGYGASKAGLIGLTRALALEGAEYGITVNAISPGFIGTEAVQLIKSSEHDHIINRIAMKRLGSPEEIAYPVVFLASEMSSYITGAAIPVSGGVDLFSF